MSLVLFGEKNVLLLQFSLFVICVSLELFVFIVQSFRLFEWVEVKIILELFGFRVVLVLQLG